MCLFISISAWATSVEIKPLDVAVQCYAAKGQGKVKAKVCHR